MIAINWFLKSVLDKEPVDIEQYADMWNWKFIPE